LIRIWPVQNWVVIRPVAAGLPPCTAGSSRAVDRPWAKAGAENAHCPPTAWKPAGQTAWTVFRVRAALTTDGVMMHVPGMTELSTADRPVEQTMILVTNEP